MLMLLFVFLTSAQEKPIIMEEEKPTEEQIQSSSEKNYQKSYTQARDVSEGN